MPALYNSDFYGWTQKQAELLRQQKWHLLDLDNLIEEIESLGRQERRELVNRLSVLLGHLLKWQYQPEQRSNSWMATIREQRRQANDLLAENPSLKPQMAEILQQAYLNGLDLAVRETNLPYEALPSECPYSLEQILSPDFFSSL